MKIGDYTLHSIVTGRFALDGGAMFGVVPKPLWEKKILPDEKNRIPMATRSLLLSGSGRNILVDTGAGEKWDAKKRAMFSIEEWTGKFEPILKRIGHSCSDITDVICTHLHFDHVGGNTRLDANGRIVPMFPEATYWIHRRNWDWAHRPSDRDRGSFMPENWEVLAENGMVRIVDGADGFLPGIEIQVTDGHTPGMVHPVITDGSTTVFFAADLVPTAAHVPIPWVMSYDLEPLKTMEEKARLLRRAVEEEWILFLEHDPVEEAVRVLAKESDFVAGDSASFSASTASPIAEGRV